MGILLYMIVDLAERIFIPWHVPVEPFQPVGVA